MKLTELIDALLDALEIHGDLNVFAEIDDGFDSAEANFSHDIIRRGYSLFVCVHTEALDNCLANATDRSGRTNGKRPEHDDLTIGKDV